MICVILHITLHIFVIYVSYIIYEFHARMSKGDITKMCLEKRVLSLIEWRTTSLISGQ